MTQPGLCDTCSPESGKVADCEFNVRDTAFPQISIVTPSFNQAEFLEETIQSVLSQDYPHLEYVVMDGGSTDGSVEIIRKYERKITYWQSKPDGGQYQAVNEGFTRTRGDIMGWINSDDKYTPWAFAIVADIFRTFPQIEWMTTLYPLTWDSDGRAIACGRRPGYSRQAFFRGQYVPRMSRCPEGNIQQESTFWRRSLWDRAGSGLDTSLRLAADFELWARFYQSSELYGIDTPLAGFRSHADQKTAHHLADYAAEARQALQRYGGAVERPAAGFVRRMLRQVRWPRPLKAIATRCRLCDARKICVYGKEGWQIQTV